MKLIHWTGKLLYEDGTLLHNQIELTGNRGPSTSWRNLNEICAWLEENLVEIRARLAAVLMTDKRIDTYRSAHIQIDPPYSVIRIPVQLTEINHGLIDKHNNPPEFKLNLILIIEPSKVTIQHNIHDHYAFRLVTE